MKSIWRAGSNFILECLWLKPRAKGQRTANISKKDQKFIYFYSQESIGALARQQKTMKKKSWRDRYRVAQGLLERLRRLVDDVRFLDFSSVQRWKCQRSVDYYFWCIQPQHGLPDVFLWLISGTKRLAYQRISSREILYSMVEEEKGRHCGVMKTIFLKVSNFERLFSL